MHRILAIITVQSNRSPINDKELKMITRKSGILWIVMLLTITLAIPSMAKSSGGGGGGGGGSQKGGGSTEPKPEKPIETVTSIDGTSITTSTGRTIKVGLGAGVTVDGRASELSNIKSGMQVTFSFGSDPTVATVVSAATAVAGGNAGDKKAAGGKEGGKKK